MQKIHKPNPAVLSHLSKPKHDFGDDLPVNPGGENLPMIATKTGDGGNKMGKMPKGSGMKSMRGMRGTRKTVLNKAMKGQG